MREEELRPTDERTETMHDVELLTEDELQQAAGGLRYPGFEQTT